MDRGYSDSPWGSLRWSLSSGKQRQPQALGLLAGGRCLLPLGRAAVPGATSSEMLAAESRPESAPSAVQRSYEDLWEVARQPRTPAGWVGDSGIHHGLSEALHSPQSILECGFEAAPGSSRCFSHCVEGSFGPRSCLGQGQVPFLCGPLGARHQGRFPTPHTCSCAFALLSPTSVPTLS